MFRVFLTFIVFLTFSSSATPSCPSGFTLINQQKCLKIFTNSQDHISASTQCTAYGGTLATVKNAIDNRAVSTLAASAGLSSVWIGIICYLNKNINCYHDDSTGVISYNSFATGFPKENFAIAQCVYLKTSGASAGQWETNRCQQETLPFVCEVPVTVIDATCKYNFNGSCYLPSHEISENSTATFQKAQNTCTAQNSNLVSIHSKQELDFIKSIYKRSGINSIFLGAQAHQPHAFNWIDGSSWDFNYRNPFDVFTGNCMQMDLSKDEQTNGQILYGTWSEISCQVAQNFLCKRKISVSTAAPVQLNYYPKHFDLSDPSNCNNTLLLAPGAITSFGYGSSPLPGAYCSWRVATTGAYRVMLHFTDFSVWYNVDVADQWGENVGRFSDNRQPFSLLVESNIVTITHLAQKDDSMGRHGFEAVVLPY